MEIKKNPFKSLLLTLTKITDLLYLFQLIFIQRIVAWSFITEITQNLNPCLFTIFGGLIMVKPLQETVK